MTGTDDEIGYAEALSELEGILGELEDDSVDIDLLGAKVERASELIRLCRTRIGAARVQVERIVAELEELAAPIASAPGEADEAAEDDEDDEEHEW